jgi:hypothetical protein
MEGLRQQKLGRSEIGRVEAFAESRRGAGDGVTRFLVAASLKQAREPAVTAYGSSAPTRLPAA